MWKSLACLSLFACVPPAESTWGAPASAGAAPVADGGRSCVEVVQCLAACPDAGCFSGCVDSAAPASRPAVDALLACNAAGGACDGELAACRGDGGGMVAVGDVGATSPDLPRQPVSNAQILPWLVGEWISSRHQFTFYPDGRVRRAEGGGMVEDHPGTYDDRHCVAVANDLGTVHQEGDLLIMEFDDRSANTCGIKETSGPTTVRYRITWFDNAYDDSPDLQLVLEDIDCTAGAMWCGDGMNRR